MKPTVCLTLVAWTCGAVLSGCTSKEPAPKAQTGPLVFESRDVDLGVVPISTQKPFKVGVSNSGDQTVQVIKVDASCGCADVKISQDVLKADERAEITGSFRAGPKPSKILKQVKVFAQTPQPRVFQFNLLGTVEREIQFRPSLVTLKPDSLQATPGYGRITVTNASEKAIAVKDVVTPQPGIRVQIGDRKLEPGASCEIDLVADPVFLSRLSDLELTVSTSHPVERTLNIPLAISPVSALDVTPSSLRFGAISKADCSKKLEYVVHLKGEMLSRLDVKVVEYPAFLAGSVRRVNDRSWALAAKFRLSHVTKYLTGTIRLQVIDETTGKEHELAIPTSGIVIDST